MADKLESYRGKRDPSRTPEPVPDLPPEPRGDDTFVIQEHHARSLHWDLRLERDGVLASWAIPKGLPEDPAINHLAVHTEDHPMEYATFEGEIPRGEYGGGAMTIWDRGTYETEKWSDREVKVVLHGERAQGRFVLFQTRGKNWMIHRMDPRLRDPLPELAPMTPVTRTRLPKNADGYSFEFAWGGRRTLVPIEEAAPPCRCSDRWPSGSAAGPRCSTARSSPWRAPRSSSPTTCSTTRADRWSPSRTCAGGRRWRRWRSPAPAGRPRPRGRVSPSRYGRPPATRACQEWWAS
ncbi:DNA polymerase ligase N-terminal domain-containing protein [Nonomuraea recticatena]|uniref:DNA polymerase ligase N-terminal domain-containing protein n=1 Tax=Nonomuraea recticatena TaxID=46178 RepID=UPI00361DE19F